MNNKKPLFLILFASLMANMFMGGIIISYTFITTTHHAPPPHHGRGAMERFERAKLSISSEGQKIVSNILKQRSQDILEDMHSGKTNIKTAQKVLIAKTLDEERLKEIHSIMNDNKTSAKSRISSIIEEIATGLSDKDRIKFFENALPNNHHRPPPRPRH